MFHCQNIKVALAALLSALTLAACQHEDGRLTVEPLLSDGAVLQQNASILVGGTASPGSLVTVSADWDFSMTATAGLDSLWSVRLTTLAADAQRHRIVVETANSSVCFSDIMIGEVWLFAGRDEDCALDHDQAQCPDTQADSLVRYFVIDKGTSDIACRFASGTWSVASADNFKGVGRVSLAFAKQLRDSLRVPVGVIVASCPGATSRAWVDTEAIPDSKMRAAAEERYDTWRYSNSRCAEWLKKQPRIAIKDATSVYDEYMCVSRPDIGLWPKISLPGKWDVAELPGFNGIVWMAKDVKIPTSWNGHRLRLMPGRIGGEGMVYANQVSIGEFDKDNIRSSSCVFDIPPSVTASATTGNILSLAFRVRGSAEKGGFFGVADGSPMRLELLPENVDGHPLSADSVISLNGDWRYYAVAITDADSLCLLGTPDNVFMESFRKSLSVPYDLCGSVSNKMLRPLAGKSVSGVICNVGEEDDDQSVVTFFLPLVARSVREVFSAPALPFYFLQKGRRLTSGLSAKGIREAQMTAVATVDGAHLVPTLDVKPITSSRADGERQTQIGHRLADAALAETYGFSGISTSAPMPIAATIHNQIINVQFTNADGLRVDPDRPTAFEVAGANLVFYPARAMVGNGGVTVFSHMVQNPVFVRYAHFDDMEPTLFNGAGLPSPSFFFRATENGK